MNRLGRLVGRQAAELKNRSRPPEIGLKAWETRRRREEEARKKAFEEGFAAGVQAERKRVAG